MRWQAIALLALLASALLLADVRAEDAEADDLDDDLEEDERARVLVRRIVADKRPLEGKDTTITIELYNAGNIPATNVKVAEAAWPADAFAVAGDLTAAFDSIPVGTSVRHSYVVTPKGAGLYTHPPATITYVAEAEGEGEQATTSSQLSFRTYSFGDSVSEQALEWGATLSLGLLTTATEWTRFAYVSTAVLAAYFVLTSYKKFSAGAKSKRQQAAYDELMQESSKTK